MAAGRTDVADELDLDARVLHLLPTGDLDLHLTRRTGSQSQRQRLCACTRHCGMGGGSRTVPHTLSDALNRYCSTSFSFTLVVTVCRVSASANVTLNFAGAPVKKELSDITRRETPTPSLVSQPASCGQVEGCERLAGRVVGERAATGSGAGSSARPALRGSTGGEARRRAGTNKRALSSGITTDSQPLGAIPLRYSPLPLSHFSGSGCFVRTTQRARQHFWRRVRRAAARARCAAAPMPTRTDCAALRAQATSWRTPTSSGSSMAAFGSWSTRWSSHTLERWCAQPPPTHHHPWPRHPNWRQIFWCLSVCKRPPAHAKES